MTSWADPVILHHAGLRMLKNTQPRSADLAPKLRALLKDRCKCALYLRETRTDDGIAETDVMQNSWLHQLQLLLAERPSLEPASFVVLRLIVQPNSQARITSILTSGTDEKSILVARRSIVRTANTRIIVNVMWMLTSREVARQNISLLLAREVPFCRLDM
jgi:hypothetical protein